MKDINISKSDAIQINPLLSFIIPNNMEGWYYERYVNLFMNDGIIDYVDNVNYGGLINAVSQYDLYTAKKVGVLSIINSELKKSHFIRLWVDEYYIKDSSKYGIIHFVHPLLIYGADLQQKTYKSIFFNSDKGQVFIEISKKEILSATAQLKKYHIYGGGDDTINNCIMGMKVSKELNGDFHVEYFINQLSNYLYCQYDKGGEWYTRARIGVYQSNEIVFGIQIYNQIIQCLEAGPKHCFIKYKAFHDFVMHKKYLLERFKYIQKLYDVDEKYISLIEQFKQVCNILEKARIKNLKKQKENRGTPTVLCISNDFIDYLIYALKDAYRIELQLLPDILQCLYKLKYPKNYTDKVGAVIPITEVKNDDCGFYYICHTDKKIYNRIDIIRNGNYTYRESNNEYVIVNNVCFLLESDNAIHSPIRTINIPPCEIKELELHTSNNQQYSIVLFPFENQMQTEKFINIPIDNKWNISHHVDITNDNNKLTLTYTGEDPFIIRDRIGIDADHYNILNISMSILSNTIYAQVFFITTDSPGWSGEKSAYFRVIPDGSPHSYYIDMKSNPQWVGKICSLRIDPSQFCIKYPWKSKLDYNCSLLKVMVYSDITLNNCIEFKENDIFVDGRTYLLAPTVATDIKD